MSGSDGSGGECREMVNVSKKSMFKTPGVIFLGIKQREGARWRDLVCMTVGAAIWTAGICSRRYNFSKDGARQAEYSGDDAVAVEARIDLMVLAVPVHGEFRSSTASVHTRRQENERSQAWNCFRLGSYPCSSCCPRGIQSRRIEFA